VAPRTEITLRGNPIPIPVPFPTSYFTLCECAVKGKSLGENAICPQCLVSGLLFFYKFLKKQGHPKKQGHTPNTKFDA